jgi:hypothetical protein
MMQREFETTKSKCRKTEDCTQVADSLFDDRGSGGNGFIKL